MPDDERMDAVFDAVADATRRGVLVSLVREGSATATQLATAFPVTRQAVAKHLQVLLDAGLVSAERRGRETVFAFVPGSLHALATWADALDVIDARQWQDDVVALGRHLAEQQARRGFGGGPVQAAASSRRPRPRA